MGPRLITATGGLEKEAMEKRNPKPVLKGHLSFRTVHLSALILQKFYGELNLHKTHIGPWERQHTPCI